MLVVVVVVASKSLQSGARIYAVRVHGDVKARSACIDQQRSCVSAPFAQKSRRTVDAIVSLLGFEGLDDQCKNLKWLQSIDKIQPDSLWNIRFFISKNFENNISFVLIMVAISA